MDLSSDDVAAFRRFTRFYTRQVELLNEGLLGSEHTLTEARVLYELATGGPVSAADVGAKLGLDAGYLSRILKSFETGGLIVRTPAPDDGRRSVITLTEHGRAAFAPLDRASAMQAAHVLAGLSPAERTSLVAAMARIEALLGGAAQPIVLRGHRPGDMGAVTSRQGALYAEEYGLDSGFEALVGEITSSFLRNFDPACERCWIAERAGEMMGSVFVVRGDDETAKLRLLYVEPSARGTGLGARLVDECIRFAREAGYKVLVLWTNDILVAARRIYLKAGFRLVEEERHHSFGQDLVGQNWRLDL